ncbi:class I SAM-dependent methyltransferase [Aporhodopirellula aestuarii]|uniref:Class I SAM-dependent methyltransferase n=1 Tax=Aporhodopirellula aestuarii TaxID=2950107 RepID=A0ABT0U4Y4_9BACT|nr:class I SAM-dependent methyltransferase [Aporhodopirellula aestuarii]MCM2371739.1 class I SAM-dependent methyltransferase [Aporhodopirellula aestuarii]
MLPLNADTRSRSQRGYDRLAPAYRMIERAAFGNQLQQARVALLDALPDWDRLLLFGDGDGRLLEQLCRLNPSTSDHELNTKPRGRITSVDHSRAMLDRQRRLVAAAGASDRVEFVHGNALGFIPEASAYDIVVMPFFVDCFSRGELIENLPCWLSALRVGGTLYHVDFVSPESDPTSETRRLEPNRAQSRWQRQRANVLLWAMHTFFRWQTGLLNRHLVEVEDLYRRCGLQRKMTRVSGGGMITSEIWQRVSEAIEV